MVLDKLESFSIQVCCTCALKCFLKNEITIRNYKFKITYAYTDTHVYIYIYITVHFIGYIVYIYNMRTEIRNHQLSNNLRKKKYCTQSKCSLDLSYKVNVIVVDNN